MGAFPINLFEMHQIGVRTRERLVAPRQAPILDEFGLDLIGISEARHGFLFVRLNPDMSQLLACVDGEGEVWANGSWRPLRAGEAYFTPAQSPHAYRAIPGKVWQVCWSKYSFASKNAPRFVPREPMVITMNPRPLWLAIEGLCEAVAGSAEESEKELWTRLVHRRVLTALAPTQGHDPRLAILWSTVDADLAHPWTLAELARRCGKSREGLRRLCVEETGRSPLREVAHRRLARAADLLRHTDDKIAAIAERVGFNDPFAFSTAFKRAWGQSPRAYRKG